VGSLHESVLGRCVIELTLKRHSVAKCHLGKNEEFCSDVLIGQDCQPQHQSVVFMYDGMKTELVASSKRREASCAVAAATAECPPLFNCLTSDSRLVCVPSRRFIVQLTLFTLQPM